MRIVALVLAWALVSSCATAPSGPLDRAERERLKKSEETLRMHAAAAQASEERLARLQLQNLDKDAQIKMLTEKLEAAILEVVRAMAKLRNRESKAEAASNLAEAEIALKLLAATARDKDPDLAQARQLLSMGVDEFNKENYGGTLYLATQAKAHINRGQARSVSSDGLPKADGEIGFSIPLSLRALSRSNIREGPGANFKVVFVVEEGAPLTGQAYKDLWVRVRREDGRWGWIFFNLVGQR